MTHNDCLPLSLTADLDLLEIAPDADESDLVSRMPRCVHRAVAPRSRRSCSTIGLIVSIAALFSLLPLAGLAQHPGHPSAAQRTASHEKSSETARAHSHSGHSSHSSHSAHSRASHHQGFLAGVGGFDLSALHQHLAPAFEALELDEAQHRELARLHQDFAPQLEEFRAAATAAHEDFARLVHGQSLDRAALEAAASDFARMQQELLVATAELLFEAQSILTEAQRARLQEMHR